MAIAGVISPSTCRKASWLLGMTKGKPRVLQFSRPFLEMFFDAAAHYTTKGIWLLILPKR
jgi:hypothetical protein